MTRLLLALLFALPFLGGCAAPQSGDIIAPPHFEKKDLKIQLTDVEDKK